MNYRLADIQGQYEGVRLTAVTLSLLDGGLVEFMLLIIHLGQITVLFEDFIVVYRSPCIARAVSIQMEMYRSYTYRRMTDSES